VGRVGGVAAHIMNNAIVLTYLVSTPGILTREEDCHITNGIVNKWASALVWIHSRKKFLLMPSIVSRSSSLV